VARLYEDYRAEEMAWHQASGFFPIMHCLAVRKDIAERHPWLPVALYRAFAAAKALSLTELQQVNVLRISLPWIAAAYEEQARAMGGDVWPYGFSRNRAEVAAMIRFAVADGLAAAPLHAMHRGLHHLHIEGTQLTQGIGGIDQALQADGADHQATAGAQLLPDRQQHIAQGAADFE
jgi:hypothetical protein